MFKVEILIIFFSRLKVLSQNQISGNSSQEILNLPPILTLEPNVSNHGRCSVPNSEFSSSDCESLCIGNRLVPSKSSCCKTHTVTAITFSDDRGYTPCSPKCVCAKNYAKVFTSNDDPLEWACVSESFCRVRCPTNAVFLENFFGIFSTLVETDGERKIVKSEHKNHNGCTCLKGFVKRSTGKSFECVSEQDAISCPIGALLKECANKQNICLNGVLMRENFSEKCELGCVCTFPNVLTFTTDSHIGIRASVKLLSFHQ